MFMLGGAIGCRPRFAPQGLPLAPRRWPVRCSRHRRRLGARERREGCRSSSHPSYHQQHPSTRRSASAWIHRQWRQAAPPRVRSALLTRCLRRCGRRRRRRLGCRTNSPPRSAPGASRAHPSPKWAPAPRGCSKSMRRLRTPSCVVSSLRFRRRLRTRRWRYCEASTSPGDSSTPSTQTGTSGSSHPPSSRHLRKTGPSSFESLAVLSLT